MSASATVLDIVLAQVKSLDAFAGVPVTKATDFSNREDDEDAERGGDGAACYIQTTEQRLQPNYDFYRVSVVVAIETHVAKGEDEDGSKLVALSDAVADWLHGVTGRDAAVALGFDGILPGATSEQQNGFRVQRQVPFDVMVTYQPPPPSEE